MRIGVFFQIADPCLDIDKVHLHIMMRCMFLLKVLMSPLQNLD